MPVTIDRPETGEFATFYARYIDYLPRDADVIATLTSQLDALPKALALAGEGRASYRYAEGKWSVREVVGHLADAERIFVYRLLRIARGDETPLPGFDENDYVRAGDFERRPLADVVGEWLAVRRATLSLASGMEPAAWERRGTANNAAISARALLYITAGHTEHHLGILRTRYGLQ
ncbi:MAG: DinB family protein [Vicinamibacterales bacterium]